MAIQIEDQFQCPKCQKKSWTLLYILPFYCKGKYCNFNLEFVYCREEWNPNSEYISRFNLNREGAEKKQGFYCWHCKEFLTDDFEQAKKFAI